MFVCFQQVTASYVRIRYWSSDVCSSDLIVWKLDRLGRTLTHLVSTVQNLSDRGIGLRVLTGKGAPIDTTTPSGRRVFGIFATLAEFARDMIGERTMAGLDPARAWGRQGSVTFAPSNAQGRLKRKSAVV